MPRLKISLALVLLSSTFLFAQDLETAWQSYMATNSQIAEAQAVGVLYAA